MRRALDGESVTPRPQYANPENRPLSNTPSKKDKKKGITEEVFIIQCPGVQDKSVVFENIATVTSDEDDVNPESNADTAAVTVKNFGMCCESSEKCCESSEEDCESSEEAK